MADSAPNDDAAAPAGMASRIDQINETAQGVQAVGGYVRLKREIRPCSREGAGNGEEEELGGPPDDGPLAGIASKVLSVTIYDKDSQPGRDRIKVFLYDAWAERLAFIMNQAHKLVLTGPCTMIRRNERAEGNDNPCVLVVAPPALLTVGTRALRRRPEVASSGPSLTVRVVDPEVGASLVIEDPDDPDLDTQVELFKEYIASTRGGGAGRGRQSAGGAARASAPPAAKYTYTRLSEVTVGDGTKMIDVYAVVASWTLPKRTSGSDMIMSMLLVDPSWPNPDHGYVCNIFAPSVEKFPAITKVGDILRCHRVKAQTYQEKPQLVGYKNRAQFVVISRAPGAPPVAPAADVESVESTEAWDDSRWARQATSVNHTFDEDDQKQVYRLWAWSRHWLSTSRLVNPEYATGPKCLEAIQGLGTVAPASGVALTHSDVTAMVVGKARQQTLILWDGTGHGGEGQGVPAAEALVDGVHQAITAAMTGPKWDELAALHDLPPSHPVPSREEVAHALLMRLGARLSVQAEPQAAPGLQNYSLIPGRWVRLKDLQLSMVEGGAPTITPKCSVNPLPLSAYDVARVAVGFVKRMRQHSKDHGHFPALMPYRARRVTDQAGQRLCYVAEAAASSPGTYHLRARIQGHWPTSARQLCQGVPRQGSRRRGGVLDWRFFFEVVLQDDTGTLCAVVADEAVRALLPSIPGCDLADPANAEHLEVIEKALAQLKDAPPQRLVIRSYLLNKRDRDGKSRRVKCFRLCSAAKAGGPQVSTAP